MTFFNGLLCASGESDGCHGVAIAQDRRSGKGYGRWWRSKTLIGQVDTPSQASFSTEMGLGVYHYLASKPDKEAFKAWLRWIDKNPRIYAPLPSYCTHKECVFKAIDCPLLVTIASRFDLAIEATHVCDPLAGLGIPSPDDLVTLFQKGMDALLDGFKRLQDAENEIIQSIGNAIGLPDITKLRPAVDFRALFDSAIALYKDAQEKLIGPEIGEAAAQLAQSIALVNAVVNGVEIKDMKFDAKLGMLVYRHDGITVEGSYVSFEPGKITYNPEGEHLAAAEVFLLRNLGYNSDELKKASEIIFLRDKDNPFFEFLKNDKPTQTMLDLILKKCPARALTH